MAEPEELIADAARHATVFAQNLWRRHRPAAPGPITLTLAETAQRLDLFLIGTCGASLPLVPAQAPAHATLLSILFEQNRRPRLEQPIPGTNGSSVWLPADLSIEDADLAARLYRAMALQQTARAGRGSAAAIHSLPPLHSDVYLLLESYAVDHALTRELPGMTAVIDQLRQQALQARPPLTAFSLARRPLEQLLRRLLSISSAETSEVLPLCDSPAISALEAERVIKLEQLLPPSTDTRQLGPSPLLKDWWTGELRPPAAVPVRLAISGSNPNESEPDKPVRTSRLRRRPEVRDATEGEDDDDPQQSAWMVQGDEPHQHAEDPMGLRRPSDRDEETEADQYGDMVSELPEARLVTSPGNPTEILLSDAPPSQHPNDKSPQLSTGAIQYPEWDCRSQSYTQNSVTVRISASALGDEQWVARTIDRHQALLTIIRRRFEVLRAQRVWHRRQTDGDDIDLNAYIDSYADFRAGHSLADTLYQSRRAAERNLAITLLIDVSGSTDSWVTGNRRIIDVEREALLLVCIALESLGEPFSVLAFSGESANHVALKQIKTFEQPYTHETALRISALEPDRYTRAGGAIRHATAELMRQPAMHRLLLLLSDGKPNDVDVYAGKYGVEDMRQAVNEAALQGIFPFCLTIDRHAVSYAPRIFGAHRYALLPEPERLPLVLLDWLKRLVSA